MKKILIIPLIALILTSFSSQAKDEDWVYTTRPGDTLWGISQTHLKSVEYWKKVQDYNRIKNPKRLSPGSRLFIPANWLKQQPTPAVIVAVSGTAYVKIANNKQTAPLKAGMKINIQSEIVTEKGATVVLRFADDSTLVIQQNSSVNMDKLTVHGSSGMVDSRMRLQRGRVESQVIPFKNKGSRFEITTPAAVASVRGTKFRVSMNPKSATMLSEVIEGDVAVASQGVTQIVPAGFGTKVVKGKPPLAPQQLISAPDLSKLPGIFHTSDISFSWPALNGASGYHIEISTKPNFYNILFDDISSRPSLNWEHKGVGAYAIRIRGINSIGSEGWDAVHEFSVVNEIAPPKLIAPRNNSEVLKHNFTIQWLGHSDAKRYHLQVSLNANFDNTVIEASGNQQYYSVNKNLAAGLYYWRVANEYDKEVYSKYSDVFQFRIND